jgi:hypothetical protein
LACKKIKRRLTPSLVPTIMHASHLSLIVLDPWTCHPPVPFHIFSGGSTDGTDIRYSLLFSIQAAALSRISSGDMNDPAGNWAPDEKSLLFPQPPPSLPTPDTEEGDWGFDLPFPSRVLDLVLFLSRSAEPSSTPRRIGLSFAGCACLPLVAVAFPAP